jgi:hypothetical protein
MMDPQHWDDPAPDLKRRPLILRSQIIKKYIQNDQFQITDPW